MTCGEFLNEAEALALGDVEASRAEALRNHASSCPPCARRLAEAEALNERLRGLRRAYVPPAGLEDRIRRSLGARRPRSGRWLTAAAAALLVVGVVALFLAAPGPAVPDLIASTISAHEELLDMSRAGRIDTGDPKALREFFSVRVEGHLASPESGDCCCGARDGCRCADPATCRQGACAVFKCGGELVTRLAVDASRLGPAKLGRGEKRLVDGREVYLFEDQGVRVAVCPCAKAVHLWIGRLKEGDLIGALRRAGREKP